MAEDRKTGQGPSGEDQLRAMLRAFESKHDSFLAALGYSESALFKDVPNIHQLVDDMHCPPEAVRYIPYNEAPSWLHPIVDKHLHRLCSTLRANCWHDGKVTHQLPESFWTGLLLGNPLKESDNGYSEVLSDMTVDPNNAQRLIRPRFYREAVRDRFWYMALLAHPRLVSAFGAGFVHLPKQSVPGKPAYQVFCHLGMIRGGTQYAQTAVVRFDDNSLTIDLPPKGHWALLDTKMLWASSVRHGNDMTGVMPTSVPLGYLKQYVHRRINQCDDTRRQRLNERFEEFDTPFVDRIMGTSKAAYETVVQPITETPASQWFDEMGGRNTVRRMPSYYPVDSAALWARRTCVVE